MERQLKERLVGAAVLMAAAIVLIPEMLSGPPRDTRPAEPIPVASDPGLKTFTIDLTRPPGSTPVTEPTPSERPAPVEDAAPPAPQPEPASARTAEAAPGPRPGSSPESTPGPKPESNGAASQASAAARQASSSPVPASGSNAAPAPQRSSPPPSAQSSGSGWAVQLGSFANRATAERMVAELRAQNHSSFVMPVRSGGQTLYRVRIGPMSERAAAEAELRKLAPIAPGAAVVAHP